MLCKCYAMFSLKRKQYQSVGSHWLSLPEIWSGWTPAAAYLACPADLVGLADLAGSNRLRKRLGGLSAVGSLANGSLLLD